MEEDKWMRVRMKTVIVDQEFRQRLRFYYGRTGIATREEVRQWREERGTQSDVDLYDETDDRGFATQENRG